ncbi:MAG: hypothetical protein ACMXX8_02970, partial [Candidatus Woesearchaeota archaeon]
LYISSINYPAQVNFNEKFKIDFLLKKDSFSNPKNVSIILTDSFNEMSWHFDEFYNDNDFIVNIDSSELIRKNKFEIQIKYFDLNNKSYYIENSFEIEITNLNLKEKSILLIREITIIIEKNLVISSLIFTLIIFLIIIPILSINKAKKELEKEKKRIKKESLNELLKEVEEQEKEDEKYFKD